jgi:hypothetical protein
LHVGNSAIITKTLSGANMAASITQLRSWLADPAGATEVLSDADYNTILAVETNEYRAAATAARVLAAQYALKVATSVDRVRIENQQKREAYLAIAQSFDIRAASGGGTTASANVPEPIIAGTSISEMDSVRSNSDRYNGAFYRGQFDNNKDPIDDE